MKKLLLAALLLLLLAVGVAQWLLSDPGYVLMVRGHWRIEGSLGLVLLLLLAGWLVSVAALAVLWWLWQVLAPASLSARARNLLAQRRLKRGLRALGKGDWPRAEKMFSAAGQGPWPYPALLGAAFAAHRQDKFAQRNQFLHAAETDADGEQFARWLRLSWQLMQGDKQAVAEIMEQLTRAPENLLLNELGAELAEKRQDWTLLQVCVKRLPRGSVTLERLKRLWQGLLRQAVSTAGDDRARLAQLHRSWREVPKVLRDEPALQVQYAGYLMQMGEIPRALKLVDEAVEKGWDDRYADLLGDMPTLTPTELQVRLEHWLVLYPAVASLSLLAGRTALRAGLWGRAEEHFRRAGEAGSMAAWAELARLKQAQGNAGAAQACLREQLRLAGVMLPELPLPHPGR